MEITVGEDKYRLRAFPVHYGEVCVVLDRHIPGGWKPKVWQSIPVRCPFMDELKSTTNLVLKNIMITAVPEAINEVGAVTLRWTIMGPITPTLKNWEKTSVFSDPGLTLLLHPEVMAS